MTSSATSSVDAQPPEGRRLTLAALTCVTFFTTCGGAFGIESLIGAIGPGWAVVLILLTPLVFSLPIALMAAELTTLMPEEGGYYIWVREALGPFWAVQEGWWTMSYSVMLLAIFPVLFVSYLGYLVPWLSASPTATGSVAGPLMRWLIGVAVIVTAMVINLRGAREVGRSAIAGTSLVLGSFLVLVAVWLAHGHGLAKAALVVSRDLGVEHKGALLLGLSIAILSYGGWDNISTYAGEVDRPQRNYPLALGAALVLAILSYALPVIAGITVTTDPAMWSADAGWPAIAGVIGGRWLGSLLAFAGIVSMWCLFDAQLLYVSRIPYVMARDGWLPSALAQMRSDQAVPSLAIILFCGVTALLTALSFGSLVVMLGLLYMLALLLELLSLVVLRVRRPEASRPFRVPGGWVGVAYACVAPLTVAGAVLVATVRDGGSFGPQFALIAAVVTSGVALYAVRRNRARQLG